ncbi:hypothetical protein [Francisella sp. 19X1-34]|uniref:hypothetical protein n=1 Tax=Francisella sp. 19X1-34 TaxID=3087177 RepID=UPI002E317EA6|nr:hypothetical protein [Francisella sp. 19X1-34]MED7788514.1 hypothetical protein [Francisella sp. 19X1-34]
MFLPLSGGVLQPLTGTIITHLKQNLGYTPLQSFQITLIFIPALMILSFIIALFIKDSKD